MRKDGYKLYEQHPSFLRYDRMADKLYLVDLTFIGFTDPKSETSIPVEEDNVYVEAFNIWRYPYDEPPQSPLLVDPFDLSEEKDIRHESPDSW